MLKERLLVSPWPEPAVGLTGCVLVLVLNFLPQPKFFQLLCDFLDLEQAVTKGSCPFLTFTLSQSFTFLCLQGFTGSVSFPVPPCVSISVPPFFHSPDPLPSAGHCLLHPYTWCAPREVPAFPAEICSGPHLLVWLLLLSECESSITWDNR